MTAPVVAFASLKDARLEQDRECRRREGDNGMHFQHTLKSAGVREPDKLRLRVQARIEALWQRRALGFSIQLSDSGIARFGLSSTTGNCGAQGRAGNAIFLYNLQLSWEIVFAIRQGIPPNGL